MSVTATAMRSDYSVPLSGLTSVLRPSQSVCGENGMTSRCESQCTADLIVYLYRKGGRVLFGVKHGQFVLLGDQIERGYE